VFQSAKAARGYGIKKNKRSGSHWNKISSLHKAFHRRKQCSNTTMEQLLLNYQQIKSLKTTVDKREK
jgi:hypothetical protein